ncbi:uncharacterized protein METZ01_LOCUS8027 [marine metagenome]|uniref:Uncharacterized protein n=1 Tax=marine metagenome TaxID=408172 RepID=A0A381NNR1_9ZZZZ
MNSIIVSDQWLLIQTLLAILSFNSFKKTTDICSY